MAQWLSVQGAEEHDLIRVSSFQGQAQTCGPCHSQRPVLASSRGKCQSEPLTIQAFYAAPWHLLDPGAAFLFLVLSRH